MRTAILLTSGTGYTVEEYVAKFGPKLNERVQVRKRPLLYCPACQQEMHTVGEGGPLRDATWSHKPTKLWCPLKESSGKPYELLLPSEANDAAGATLRTNFFSNWRRHWGHVLEIVPMCNIFTFIGFIHYADTKRLWSRAAMEEWLFPYFFLATCDFPPPKSPKAVSSRPHWIRCRFDARIRTSEDLWIRVKDSWGIVVAQYHAPKRGAEPGPRHLIDAKRIDPDKAFITRVRPAGNPYQVRAMEAAFASDLS